MELQITFMSHLPVTEATILLTLSLHLPVRDSDLISSTDDEAAMIRTEIYQGEAAEGTVFKSQQVANIGASELYQIPVLSCEDMPYGTYTVKVQVYKESYQ